MEIKYLSSEFYKKYSNCTEILRKESRPYVIIVLQIGKDKFAIPIRSHLHKTQDCFESNPQTNSGLDFTKALFIEKDSYIEATKFPEITHKEFNYIKFKEREIKLSFEKFLMAYKKDVLRHKKNPKIPQNPRFRFCTFQYFHKELGLE